MATYQFKILTPSTKVIDEQVVSLVAPGEAGYLGVLANQATLITTLQAGTLKVTTESTGEKWFRVSGGILKVARNLAVLLSETVEEVAPDQQPG
jgi:F-type H+-transporting ATPase subunit epsilon